LQSAGKIIVVPLHFFGSTSTISRFGECFRDGQYSLVSFLFAVLRAQSFVKVGNRAPVPYGVGAIDLIALQLQFGFTTPVPR